MKPEAIVAINEFSRSFDRARKLFKENAPNRDVLEAFADANEHRQRLLELVDQEKRDKMVADYRASVPAGGG